MGGARAEALHHRDQRQRAEKGDEVIEGSGLLGGQRGGAEGGAGGIAGAIEPAPDGEGNVLPIGEHRIPLAQHRARQLAHRPRHLAHCVGDFGQRAAHSEWPGDKVRLFRIIERQFRHPPYRPHDGGDRQDRPDHEGDPHDHRNAVGIQHIAGHERGEQRGREIGQRLGEAGKGALGQEPGRSLVMREPVGDIGAVGLHRDVVAGIEDPQQAGRHPQRARKGHGEQRERADHRADQEIGRAAAQPGVGAVAHRADDRLDDQAGHRPRQPQQRHRRLVRAEKAVDRPHIGLLQSEGELQPEKADIHLDDSQQRKPGFFRHVAPLQQSCPARSLCHVVAPK